MQRVIVILSVLVTGLVGPTKAVEFPGGTGEPDDPYQIATAEQLIAMGQDAGLYNRHFVLVADIDLDPNLPGGRFFREAVISWARSVVGRGGGKSYVQFSGSFDGGGHAIRNCAIYAQTDGLNTALFHSVGPQGCVRNLHLENVMIIGMTAYRGYCAALAGENGGLIANCSANGTIVAGSWLNGAGGLVGSNTGVLIRCHSWCQVSGDGVGGLVGVNGVSGRIELCSSGGVVFDSGSSTGIAGGLAGMNFGVVRCCSSAGYVLGNDAGGLVGSNAGTVRECYSLASLLASWVSGGVAGANSGTIINCYVPVSVPGDGLVGRNTGTIASCYSIVISQPMPIRRSTRSGLVTNLAGGSPDVRYVYYLDSAKPEVPPKRSVSFGYGMSRSPLQMADRKSFVGFDFYGDANDGTEDHWFMPDEGYPVLAWQTQYTGLTGVPDVTGLRSEEAQARLERAGFEVGEAGYDSFSSKGLVARVQSGTYVLSGLPVRLIVGTGPYDFVQNAGDGSEANPFQIETAGQFESLRDRADLWNSHFVLTADIDLTGRTYQRALVGSFGGTFDGNGHSIRGLKIQKPAISFESFGMFGMVAQSGVVCNLTLQGAVLDSDRYGDQTGPAGLLAGESHGRIERCRVSGRIDGGDQVGGLVGLNTGRVVDSRAGGSMWARGDRAGGLVGDNRGLIEGCCARDIDVYGYSQVGGLAGCNHGGFARVQACYTQGAVQGAYVIGGLLGENGSSESVEGLRFESGAVRDCYAACSVTAGNDAGGCIGYMSLLAEQTGCFFLPSEAGGLNNGLGTPLTGVQMMQQASFVGWDFESAWTICEGVDYPRLKWEMVNCEVGP